MQEEVEPHWKQRSFKFFILNQEKRYIIRTLRDILGGTKRLWCRYNYEDFAQKEKLYTDSQYKQKKWQIYDRNSL